MEFYLNFESLFISDRFILKEFAVAQVGRQLLIWGIMREHIAYNCAALSTYDYMKYKVTYLFSMLCESQVSV